MRTSPYLRCMALAAMVAVLLFTTSCRKQCTCYGYDGAVVEYSKEEVKAAGVSCDNMRFQFGTNFYSLCEW